MDKIETPPPALKAGEVYSGDNGRLICLECAGATALYTGFDLSGLKLMRMTKTHSLKWYVDFEFNIPMSCECGKTTIHITKKEITERKKTHGKS